MILQNPLCSVLNLEAHFDIQYSTVDIIAGFGRRKKITKTWLNYFIIGTKNQSI